MKHLYEVDAICPICGLQAFYELDTRLKCFSEIKKQKSITLFCSNNECRCTFIIRRKERQKWLFSKKSFRRHDSLKGMIKR